MIGRIVKRIQFFDKFMQSSFKTYNSDLSAHKKKHLCIECDFKTHSFTFLNLKVIKPGISEIDQYSQMKFYSDFGFNFGATDQ